MTEPGLDGGFFLWLYPKFQATWKEKLYQWEDCRSNQVKVRWLRHLIQPGFQLWCHSEACNSRQRVTRSGVRCFIRLQQLETAVWENHFGSKVGLTKPPVFLDIRTWIKQHLDFSANSKAELRPAEQAEILLFLFPDSKAHWSTLKIRETIAKTRTTNRAAQKERVQSKEKNHLKN